MINIDQGLFKSLCIINALYPCLWQNSAVVLLWVCLWELPPLFSSQINIFSLGVTDSRSCSVTQLNTFGRQFLVLWIYHTFEKWSFEERTWSCFGWLPTGLPPHHPFMCLISTNWGSASLLFCPDSVEGLSGVDKQGRFSVQRERNSLEKQKAHSSPWATKAVDGFIR